MKRAMCRRFLAPARVLPAATPRMLAFVRMVICGILLLSVGWENLASSALLPRGMREPLGILGPLEAVSGGAFAWLCRTAWALQALQFATGTALALALAGLWTRVSVPLGAVLYLLLGGILREYSSFYHTGLVPLYALGVLAFAPCGEAWSLDRWRRQRAGREVAPADEPRLIDAWSVYAVWIVVAVPYVSAGLHKIRAGPGWFHPHSFKAILLRDALQPMHFDFDFTAQILALPEAAITALAVVAVAAELAMGAVLFSRRARWILPPLMAGMHVGILLVQRVLFFDLILIQLIFLAPPRWFARAGAESAAAAWPARWPRPVLALLAALAVVWVGRIEWYPLSGMPMYTRVDPTGVIRYPQILAVRADGATEVARPERVIGAMADARYRQLLRASKSDENNEVAREFFATCGRLFNERRGPSERIVAFEVVWRRWDFARQPGDPARGKINKRLRYELAPPG